MVAAKGSASAAACGADRITNACLNPPNTSSARLLQRRAAAGLHPSFNGLVALQPQTTDLAIAARVRRHALPLWR